MNNRNYLKSAARCVILATTVMMVLALAGCAQATPTLIPTLAVTPPGGSSTMGQAASGGAPSGGVTASAEVRPARVAEIGFALAGFVKEINVQEGDSVRSGQPLAALSNLEELQAVVDASQQNLASAQKALDSLTTAAPLALANAQMAVIHDQKRYDDALKHLKRSDVRRCSKDNLDLYTKRYDDAKDRLERIKEASDGSLYALEQIREAQNVFNIAQANYIYCLGYTEQEITESNAELAVAEAALKQSSEQYDKLLKENGLDPDDVARLNAAIASAQAGLVTAQSALERATVYAPFDAVVIQINALPGQAITPGQPIFVLANLSPLQIETTDLSERDINRVTVGQSAQVTIEALGQEFPGKVVKIDPRASKIGGDVVYKVTIQLDQQPENLRWGMSARVVIR